VRDTTIAERYALAFLDIGVERETYEQQGRELARVAELFQVDDVKQLFGNPKFDSSVRKSVLGGLLEMIVVSPISRNFLMLLVDRRRIGLLPEIVNAYNDLADKRSQRLRARVRVAKPLAEADLERLRTILQQATGQTVVVDQEEDASILGGVVTHIGGRVYDGSIRTQLKSLRSDLKRNRT
jgi:F-type H+-transporting ATPase subunit delta